MKAKELSQNPLLVLNQSLGLTYVRINNKDNTKEYLSYAGGNETRSTDDPDYENRVCEDQNLFGKDKPCMCINQMPLELELWTVIENV